MILVTQKQKRSNVESLKFVVSQFSWYWRVALSQEFTSSTKTNFERVSFLTEAENQSSYKITSPRITKNTQSMTIAPLEFKWFHSMFWHVFFFPTQICIQFWQLIISTMQHKWSTIYQFFDNWYARKSLFVSLFS